MCIISIITSVIVIDCAIVNVYKKNTIDTTIAMYEMEFHEIYKGYINARNRADYPEAEEIFAMYYFKNRNDDLTIYIDQKNNNSIFNHTVFNMEDLQGFFEKNCISLEDDVRCVKVDWKGKSLFIFNKSIGENMLYHVFDISYLQEDVESMIVAMVVVSVAVIIVMVLCLTLFLKKAFKPVQEIMITSTEIAAGNYDKRIQVKNSDEIGVMAQSFNEMAQAVQNRIKELEEEQVRKTMFMGNLAHEMKTPLSAIYGYAQTLQTIKLSRENEEKAFKYIEEESLRLSHLFEKLMKLVLKNEETVKEEEIEVKELFEKAITSCHKKIQDKNIRVKAEETTQVISADKELFLDVLINLLDNALNASENDSEIRIYTKQGDCKQIIVEDFGKGIAKEEIERIVEPFYMVDKSRSRKSGGAGLGLALVSTILEKHNMTLSIESEEGKGTKMIINIM